MFINGIKFACSSCVKGHRSSKCKHTDRPIYEIRKKGRPVTQCTYCRELRKTRQIHIKCPCIDKLKSNTNSGNSTLVNVVNQPTCSDCQQQPEKQPLLIDYTTNSNYKDTNVLIEQQNDNALSVQCSCHELTAKLLKNSNDIDIFDKLVTTTTPTISALSASPQQTKANSATVTTTSDSPSSLSKSFPIKLAAALDSELYTSRFQTELLPSLSYELHLSPSEKPTKSIHDEHTVKAVNRSSRKCSFSRKIETVANCIKKRRSTISTIPILPQHHMSTNPINNKSTILSAHVPNNGGIAVNNSVNQVENLQQQQQQQQQQQLYFLDATSHFSQEASSRHFEKQQQQQQQLQQQQMANNSETINNQPITAASIDMDTAQEISHDLALTSSAVPLQQLSSFSDPVNLPHIQKNDDDIILTHDQNSNIDLDEDILMAERNNLSLLDNLILPRNDQCTGILGSESIFCERQRGTFDSVQMIRTATTTSSSSSTFSTVSQQSTTDAISEMPICLDQQQFAFHQQQDQLQNKFRPTMSTPSFLKHSQQQQGESVMITITPLSSLIDTSTGNLLLNPTSTIINNNNTKHITTTATTADSMNNISASTVTRIITCFNGSECDCPGCFVHLDNNNIYASSAITNTTVADQQSSFYLQQQQSFVQPYHYPLSSSTTSASSNYSSSDEDERRYG